MKMISECFSHNFDKGCSSAKVNLLLKNGKKIITSEIRKHKHFKFVYFYSFKTPEITILHHIIMSKISKIYYLITYILFY